MSSSASLESIRRAADGSSDRLRSVKLAETLVARESHANVRVRLLIAIPVLIVFIITIIGGVFYNISESRFSEMNTAAGPESFAREWFTFLFFFNIGGAVIGYAIAHSITKPIQDLIRITEKVAGGDFTTKADTTGHDEVGQLGYTFNYMIDSLNSFITQRNRFILESFSGGLMTTDVSGNITAINSAAERLLGLGAGEAAGRSVQDVLGPAGLNAMLGVIEETLWKHQQIVSRMVTLQVQNSTVTLSVNASEMRDEDGEVYGIIVNFRDYAEWQKFHEQLHRSDRLATVGTFATGLAHEIRNPLGAIKATAQLLAEDVADNPRAVESTQLIVKEVNRLDNLVREVQSFSQPSAAAMESVDINALVADALYLARHNPKAAHDAKIEVREFYENLPRAVVSRDKVNQALLNIILNAFQATPPGGSVTVHTHYSRSSKLPIQIRIMNTGSSIPEDGMTRVFEPFFTTKESGTGLGLSISYQIITHHGGDIQVASEDNSVSFTIRLPAPEKEHEHTRE